MRKKLFFIPLLVATVVATGLTGCAATGSLSTTMAGLQGESVTAAYAAWGEPEATTPLGEQTLMTWRDYAPAAFAHSPVVVCERQLAVDGDGTITGWRWRGDACESLDATARSNGAYALAR